MSNVTNLDTYRRIPTSSIIDTVERALTDDLLTGVDVGTTKRVRNDGRGTKHMITWDLVDQTAYINGDKITPRIILYNSYEKECALTLHIGFLRWVCNNGMFTGDATYATRIIHRVGETCEDKLDELYTGVAAAIQFITSGELVRQMNDATSKRLSTSEMCLIAAQLGCLSKRSKLRLVEKIIRPGLRLREEDRNNTVWTLWNMVNEEIRTSSRGGEVRLAERNNGLLSSISELAA